MSIAEKHQCPSCGGYLSIDNDKQMYRCFSCGSAYDFDYFREEKLIDLGYTYLSRGEFEAAVDVFRLYLQKNPHDHSALRGLMLAAAQMQSIEMLSNDKPEEFSYDPKMVTEAVESASEEDREYFTEFGKILSDKKKLADQIKEIRSLKDDRQKLEANIRLTDDSRYHYYFTTKNGSLQKPKSRFITNWCFAGFFALNAISFVFPVIDLGAEAAWVLLLAIVPGLAAAGITIGNLKIVYPRVKKIEKIDQDIEDLKAEWNRMGETIKARTDEKETFSFSIMNSCRDLIEKDNRITDKTVRDQGPGMSTIRKHQCPSCGGGLIIDNDKQMYYCTFCGSTYDYEYFREDRIHEAGETYISRSEFMAAIDAYKFTLKKDPHDFLALRGLMLAAANLSNMSELEKDPDATEFSYDSQLVDEVIASASEEDRKFFTKFGEVYREKKKRADCNKEIESLMKNKNEILSVISQNDAGRENYYVKDRYGTKRPPMMMFVISAVLSAVWTLVVIFFVTGYFSTAAAGKEHPEILGWLAFFHGFICIGFFVHAFVICLPKVIKIRNINAANKMLYDELGTINMKRRELEDESAKHAANIRKHLHDFVKMDRTILNGKRN